MANVVQSNPSRERTGAFDSYIGNDDRSRSFIPVQLSYSFKAVKKSVDTSSPVTDGFVQSSAPARPTPTGSLTVNNITPHYNAPFPAYGETLGYRRIVQDETQHVFNTVQSNSAQSNESLQLNGTVGSSFNDFPFSGQSRQSSSTAWSKPLIQTWSLPQGVIVDSGNLQCSSIKSAYDNELPEPSQVISETHEPPSLGLPPGARAVRKRGEKIFHDRRSSALSDTTALEGASLSAVELEEETGLTASGDIGNVHQPEDQGEKSAVNKVLSTSISHSSDTQQGQNEVSNNGENNNGGLKVRELLNNGFAVTDGDGDNLSAAHSSARSEEGLETRISSVKKSSEQSGQQGVYDGPENNLATSEQLSKTDSNDHSAPVKNNLSVTIPKDKAQSGNEVSLAYRSKGQDSGSLSRPENGLKNNMDSDVDVLPRRKTQNGTKAQHESQTSTRKKQVPDSRPKVPSSSNLSKEGSKPSISSVETIGLKHGKSHQGVLSEHSVSKQTKENTLQSSLKGMEMQRSKGGLKPEKSFRSSPVNGITVSSEKGPSVGGATANEEGGASTNKSLPAKENVPGSSTLEVSASKIHSPQNGKISDSPGIQKAWSAFFSNKSVGSSNSNNSNAAGSKKLKKKPSLPSNNGEKRSTGDVQSLIAGDKLKVSKPGKDNLKRPSADKDSNAPSKRPTLNKQQSQLHRPGHTRNSLFDANWRTPPSTNESHDEREKSADKSLASSSSKEDGRGTSSNAYTRPILHQSSSFTRSEALKNVTKPLSAYQLPFLAPSESLDKASWVKPRISMDIPSKQSTSTASITGPKVGLVNKAESTTEKSTRSGNSPQSSDGKLKTTVRLNSQHENGAQSISSTGGSIRMNTLGQEPQPRIAHEEQRKSEVNENEVNISRESAQRQPVAALARHSNSKASLSAKGQKGLNLYECNWGECNAKLHSSEALRMHGYKSHVLKKPADVILCKWEGCHSMLPKTMKNGWLHHFAEHGKTIANHGEGYVVSLDQSLFHPPTIISSSGLGDIYYTPEARPAPSNYKFPTNILEINDGDGANKTESSIDDTPDKIANREQMIAVFAAMGAGWDNEEYEDDPCPILRTGNEGPLLSGDGKTRWWHVQMKHT